MIASIDVERAKVALGRSGRGPTTLPTGTDPAVERAARRRVQVSLINSSPNDPEAIQAWFDEVFSG
jgi:hypothetical protein